MSKKLCFTILGLILLSKLNAQIIYVDSSAINGANTGDSWENAFVDLQDALSSIPADVEIWVAKGTYFPTSENNREIYFELPSGAQLIGGFQGGETSIDQRDWENNLTVLSANIGESEDSTDNSYSILYANTTDTTTVVDGFVFKGGQSDDVTPLEPYQSHKKNGGAVYLNGEDGYAALTIANCVFENNFSGRMGGAIYLNGINGTTGVKIQSCYFSKNKARVGGALYQTGGLEPGFGHQISQCTFTNNECIMGRGGGLTFEYIEGVVDYRIESCYFGQNKAISSFGGAAVAINEAYFDGPASYYFTDCVFEENDGPLDGASIMHQGDYFHTTSLHLNRCVFRNNSGNNDIKVHNWSSVPSISTFRNCEFYGSKIRGRARLIDNCIFENNSRILFSNSYVDSLEQTAINNCTFICQREQSPIKMITGTNLSLNNSIIVDLSGWDTALIETSTGIAINNCLFSNTSCEQTVKMPIDSTMNCSNTLFADDPMFRDVENRDFTLKACSPAINAGDSNLVVELLDANGNPRILDGQVDLGAFESQLINVNYELESVSCFGNTDGAAWLSLSGGQAPFEIVWANGAVGEEAINLSSGWTTFTATDIDGCIYEDSVFIESPEMLEVSGVVNNASGFDTNDGQISDIEVSGGIPPYAYQWDNGSTQAALDNLVPGTYTLTVTDANGCTFEIGFLVSFLNSLNGLDTEVISVYPNLVSKGESIFIEFDHLPEERQWFLYNTNGQLIDFSESQLQTVERIRFSAPEIAGTYFLKIKTGEDTTVRKVVVK